LIAAGIAAVGTVAGAAISSSGAKSAAKTQAATADRSLALQQRLYDQNKSNFGTEIGSGDWANSRLDALLGRPDANGNVSDATSAIRSMPGYQFGMDQALRGVNANAYANGMAHSGAAYKALSDRAQNVADMGYQGYFNQLMAQANRGSAAKSSLAGVSQNYGNAASTIMQNSANAQSAATMGSANAWSNAINNLGAIGGQLYQSSFAHPSINAGTVNSLRADAINTMNSDPGVF